MAANTFAAIDVGSYEVEMVIYEISAKGIKELDHVRHVIALGKDTYKNGAISHELIGELCDVLYGFVDIMKTYDVRNYRAYATRAVREAKNALNVLDRIKVSTGIDVQILSNSEQRLVMYEAVASRKEAFASIIEKGVAMVDVGSGSSQISLFDNGSLVTTQNVQLGALRMSELLQDVAGNKSDDLPVMEEYIDTDIEVLKNLFIKDRKIECLLAVGEGVNWLRNQLEDKSREYYSRDEFIELYHKLYLGGNKKFRTGINHEISEFVLPSLMIYKKILDITGAQTLWIPGVKLCDGIAAEYALKEKKISVFDHDFNADIVAAARNISKRYSWNKDHIKFVEKNALTIFDTTKKLHGLGKRERLLLQIACILHDCGQYISMTHPSECSYNIIMSTEIIGLSHIERKMIANIVKYTTVSFNRDDELQHVFSTENYLIVSKLTAIIRLANSLDRGHRQKFKDCTYSIKDGEFRIVTGTYDDITLERGIISDKKTFFEEVYGLKPVIIQKRRLGG